MTINFKIAPIIYTQERVIKNYHTKIDTIEQSLKTHTQQKKKKKNAQDEKITVTGTGSPWRGEVTSTSLSAKVSASCSQGWMKRQGEKKKQQETCSNCGLQNSKAIIKSCDRHKRKPWRGEATSTSLSARSSASCPQRWMKKHGKNKTKQNKKQSKQTNKTEQNKTKKEKKYSDCGL